MNTPVLIVAGIMTLTVVAHVIGGTRETATLEPKGGAGKAMANFVQTMCAFQMLTVDLVVVTGLLFAVALWDVLPNERMIVLGLAGYFAVQGVMWLGNVIWLRREGATVLTLPHWMVWFACAGLLIWGA